MIKLTLIGATLFFSLLTVSVSSPIYGVLALIGVFILTAFLFLLNNVELLAFIYLLIYVGALLILFLWIVMTMPIKQKLFLHLRLSVVAVLISFLAIWLFFLPDLSSTKVVNFSPQSALFSSFVEYLKLNVNFQFFLQFSEKSNSFSVLSKLIPPALTKQVHAVKMEPTNFLYTIYTIYAAQHFIVLSPITLDSTFAQQLLTIYTNNCSTNQLVMKIYNIQFFLCSISALNFSAEPVYLTEVLNDRSSAFLLIPPIKNGQSFLNLILPSCLDLKKYIFVNPNFAIKHMALMNSANLEKNISVFPVKLFLSSSNKTFIDLSLNLYQNFAFCLFISGLILLIALVGAVALVKFQKNETKAQVSSLQTKRDEYL